MNEVVEVMNFRNDNGGNNGTELIASDGVVALAPSEGKVWVALSNGAIEIRDCYSGTLCHFFEPPSRSEDSGRPWCMLAVKVHDDRQEQMWVGLSSGAIEVLSCTDYSMIRRLKKHLSGIYSLVSNYIHVYSASSDFTIAQWRMSDGQLCRVYNGHTNYVRCLYAEGATLFSGSDDRTIQVWDSVTGDRRKVLTHHSQSGGVSALCRVGVNMWSGDSCGSVAQWTVTNPEKPIFFSRLHDQRIFSLELVGTHIYASCADGRIAVLHGVTGEVVNRFSNHAGRLSSVRCLTEIHRMYFWTGATDQTIRAWHHDEYHTSLPERQRCNDMMNFYAIHKPYVEKNNAVIEKFLDLKELCGLADKGEEGIQTAMINKQVDLLSKSAQALILASTLNSFNKEFSEQEIECRRLQKVKVERAKALDLLQAKLQNLETAVQTLQKADPEVVNTILKWTAPSVSVSLPP